MDYADNVQLPFPFLPDMDDELQGTIEGMNPQAWIHRHLHPTAEAALKEARRALPLLGRVYAVEFPVEKGFERYWPHSTYWRVTEKEPFSGVVGTFYHPVPPHYTLDQHGEDFDPGESPEDIKIKEKMARDAFNEQERKLALGRARQGRR